MIVSVKNKEKQEYKCYRCGYTRNEKIKYCPKCIEDGFQIRMIQKMED